MYISDLHENDLEIAIKVVIVGNGAVGKSSMIQRYCKGVFTKNYKKTIGVDFLEKQMRIMSEDVRLMLWDTAGQEEFDAITKAYYRGAQACVVAFSTTDRASFDAVKKWKRKVEEECGGSSIPMVLVQNKIDLMHQSAVTSEEVDALARECRMRLYRTSVKEDINICNVFQHLAENYVNKVKGSLMTQRHHQHYHHHHHPQPHQRLSPFDLSTSDSLSSSSASSSSSSTTSSSSSPPLSFMQIGARNGASSTLTPVRNGNNKSAAGSTDDYSSPQEYLDNPMFASLNSRKKPYWSRLTAPTVDTTIVLKPLSQLTRKKSTVNSLPPPPSSMIYSSSSLTSSRRRKSSLLSVAGSTTSSHSSSPFGRSTACRVL